jgi:hypothetical protein
MTLDPLDHLRFPPRGLIFAHTPSGDVGAMDCPVRFRRRGAAPLGASHWTGSPHVFAAALRTSGLRKWSGILSGMDYAD